MRDYFQCVERDLFDAQARASIPIKAITFKATTLSPVRSGSREVTSREATALLIAAKASGCSLEPDQVVSRSFSLAGEDWIIENGCGQEIAQVGLAHIEAGPTPRDDRFVLTARFIQWLETRVGRRRLSAFMAVAVPSHMAHA